MNRLRFAKQSEYDRASSDLLAWGMGRTLADYNNVTLIEVGSSVAWVWFEWIDVDMLAVHLAANPNHRKTWFTKHVYTGIKYAAELMGASHIYALVCSNDEMMNYCQRMGWVEEDTGWYLCLDQINY